MIWYDRFNSKGWSATYCSNNRKVRFSVLIDWIPTWTHYVDTLFWWNEQTMFTDFVQEKKELILAIPKNRKLSDLPKIHQVHFRSWFIFWITYNADNALISYNFHSLLQPTLIIWGEHDHLFPLEYAHKLKMWVTVALVLTKCIAVIVTESEFSIHLEHRHLGENAQLAIIKGAGHAINAEKSKEFNKQIKSFLIDFKRSQISPSAKQ